MRDIGEFANSPWQSANIDRFAESEAVPTMLALDEQRLYGWLTACWMEDVGDVVDLGCFIGGSTARLAAGLAAGGRKARLHAYDKFGCEEALKKRMLYPAGIAPFDGIDILPLARKLLTPWSDRVTLYPGMIEDQIWDNGPIEILIMDASKKVATMDAMARLFFPSLIPGKSIVVQQDFLQWCQPWVPIQMEAMADWFTPVAHAPDNTVVFLNTRQIDTKALEAGHVGAMRHNKMLSILRRALKRGNALGYGKALRRSVLALKANPGVTAAHEIQAPTDR